MSQSKLDNLITQMESHLECWKQFNHYLVMAQAKRFEPEDESQFLEIKSAITQDLELILAAVESGAPSREDVHALLASCPSIRYLSEINENALRAVENTCFHRSRKPAKKGGNSPCASWR